MAPLQVECFLVPGGNQAAMQPLWHLDIVNITPGRTVADYLAELQPEGRTAGVYGHRRDQGSELLVRNALTAILDGAREPERQQVPSRILDLLDARGYWSTACRTEHSVRACRDPRLPPLVQELGYPDVAAYADDLCKSCRRQDKYIGDLCGCHSHPIEIEIPV